MNLLTLEEERSSLQTKLDSTTTRDSHNTILSRLRAVETQIRKESNDVPRIHYPVQEP
jgi:hypothetical protein